MTKKFELAGIDCAVCGKRLEDGLNKMDGVSVKFSFLTEVLTVTAEDAVFEDRMAEIKKKIKKFEPDSSLKPL